MPYERDNIQGLSAYTPGEQPEDATVIKLNTNENPYPPPDAVLRAIAAVTADALRRYPPPRAQRFRLTAAQLHGVNPEQVIATNGGDELLRLAVTVFCQPSSRPVPSGRVTSGGLGCAEPSYSLYPVLAGIHDTPITSVPLEADFSLPRDFAQRVLAADCTLVMIVNPHAPSGLLTPVDKLRDLALALRGRAVLLIDEAYVDFADHDALELVRDAQLDNVLLLRTLSKGYSLAGLRFGYGLGHAGLIAALDKARDSYNTDVLAQHAAAAALHARDQAAVTWKKIISERARLTAELSRRRWTVPPSQSNFILATPPAGLAGAADIYRTLKRRRILVRYFDQDRLRDKLRITIGSPEQNDALLAALDQP